MFSFRAKQLERLLLNYIDSLTNEEEKEFAKIIYGYCFLGIAHRQESKKESFLESLYRDFSQEPQLAEIFSRSIAKLSMEEGSAKILNRLFALILFFYHFSNEFIDPNTNIIDKQKLETFNEFLKSGKKELNTQVKTIDQMVEIFMDLGEHNPSSLLSIESWENVLEALFGKYEMEGKVRPKKLESENIKTLLLELRWQGTLVDTILEKYMGLVNFGMSMLTLLSGTPFEGEFKNKVNDLLSELGAARRIVIIQKNLRELSLKHRELTIEIEALFSQVALAINKYNLGIEPQLLLKFVDEATKIPQFDIKRNKGTELSKNPEMIPGFKEIFSISSFGTIKESFLKYYSELQSTNSEIHKNLGLIDDFLNGLIARANSIVSELLSKKFKGSLPISEVEKITRAGIRIESIISKTAAGSAINIPERIKKRMQQNTQELLHLWERLQNYLEQKVKEEDVITGIPDRLRIFRNMKRTMGHLFDELHEKRVLRGPIEQSPLILAYLMAAVPLLREMVSAIENMKRIPYNKNNIPQFMDTIELLAHSMDVFEILTKIILNMEDFLLLIAQLDRPLLFRICTDPNYLRDFNALYGQIEGVKRLIKRKYQQKIITETEKKMFENMLSPIPQQIAALRPYYGPYTELLANRLESIKDLIKQE